MSFTNKNRARRPEDRLAASLAGGVAAALLMMMPLCLIVSQAYAGSREAGAHHAVLNGRLKTSAINEASGMAASTRTSDLLWIVNDSGGRAVLHAVDTTGEPRGRVAVAHADNRDWEDLAAFRLGDRNLLLIADVGDNYRVRTDYELLIVQEPRLADTFSDQTVAVERRITFRYPDAAHDCEAVAVDTTAGRIFLLTKRDVPPILFSLPLAPPPDAQKQLIAEKVALIGGIGAPTAMDIDADASRAVVLTYGHAYLFVKKANQSWREAFARTPRTILLPLPEQELSLRQRETICFSRDGGRVYVTSEGVGAAIYYAPIAP